MTDPDADTDPDMLPVHAGDTSEIPVVAAALSPAVRSRWTLVVRVRYILVMVMALTGTAVVLRSCFSTSEKVNYPYGG